MGLVGVGRAEVHGRDAKLAEAGDVGPAVLGGGLAPHGGKEFLRRGAVQPGTGSGRKVDHLHLVALEQALHGRLRLLGGLVGGVAVVDVHAAGVGDDVARHSPTHLHGVEPLPEGEPLHLDLFDGEGGQPLQHAGQVVDGVVAQPAAGAVGGGAAGGDPEPHRPLAASLDPG